mmetsp:Transcript_20622/g.58673  ORF Transcript_20622/g.58673 Transcript_20622/m.58673 type:complete len:229 (-) Transcript_20622:174-860(-)
MIITQEQTPAATLVLVHAHVQRRVLPVHLAGRRPALLGPEPQQLLPHLVGDGGAALQQVVLGQVLAHLVRHVQAGGVVHGARRLLPLGLFGAVAAAEADLPDVDDPVHPGGAGGDVGGRCLEDLHLLSEEALVAGQDVDVGWEVENGRELEGLRRGGSSSVMVVVVGGGVAAVGGGGGCGGSCHGGRCGHTGRGCIDRVHMGGLLHDVSLDTMITSGRSSSFCCGCCC